MSLLSPLAILAALLSSLSILVNKYVLSVLLFTYPTLFQGWQCAFVVASLLMTSYCGILDMSIPQMQDAVFCLPSATAFSLSIYSGSRALQQLSVAVYCSLACVVDTVMTSSVALRQGRPSAVFLFLLTLFHLLSTCLVVYNDFDYDERWSGYLWMSVSCVSACLSTFLRKDTPESVSIEKSGRVLVDHVISITLLLLYGFVSEQLVTAQNFTHIYNMRFHVGLLGSGVLCGIATIVRLKLPSSLSLSVTFEVRAFVSFIGVVLLRDDVSVAQAVWIVICHACVLVLGFFERKVDINEQDEINK
ncbi:transmembrane protein 241-like [Corticium candelabrum]|uniref:transmembrane protein 241-like n=1 Tax=Corticium candelabrum TaxID=121492 RepID=UPI002E25EB8E|nr:transmembrane protein 241-like [Corticium candelabrum]